MVEVFKVNLLHVGFFFLLFLSYLHWNTKKKKMQEQLRILYNICAFHLESKSSYITTFNI